DVVIFDKTGTLTRGTPVMDEASGDPIAIGYAAAVEGDSEHPLARAIVEGVRRSGLTVPYATDFEPLPGRGARARVDGHDVAVGGPRLLADLGLEPDPRAANWEAQGRTVLQVVVDGQLAGVIALEDEVRPESADAVT